MYSNKCLITSIEHLNIWILKGPVIQLYTRAYDSIFLAEIGPIHCQLMVLIDFGVVEVKSDLDFAASNRRKIHLPSISIENTNAEVIAIFINEPDNLSHGFILVHK